MIIWRIYCIDKCFNGLRRHSIFRKWQNILQIYSEVTARTHFSHASFRVLLLFLYATKPFVTFYSGIASKHTLAKRGTFLCMNEEALKGSWLCSLKVQFHLIRHIFIKFSRFSIFSKIIKLEIILKNFQFDETLLW